MGVFVIGMHRSGTSALTRLIADLGLFVGSHDDLMPATVDNEAGYFESVSLSEQNDRLLGCLGGEPLAPPVMDDGWLERLAEVVGQSLDVLDAAFGGRSWLWKDPRNCLLLPFWRRILADAEDGHTERHVAVAVFRHPAEVAASLEKRDSMDVEIGLALWEFYVRASLDAMASMPVYCTTYDAVVDSPERVLADMVEFLTAHGVDVDPAAVPSEARNDLRHHRRELDDGVEPHHAELWSAVQGLAGSHEAFEPPDLEPMSGETLRVLSETRGAARRTVAEFAAELEHRQQVIEELAIELEYRNQVIDDLGVELDSRDRQVAAAVVEADRWRGSVDRLAAECDARDNRLKEVERELESARARIHVRAAAVLPDVD